MKRIISTILDTDTVTIALRQADATQDEMTALDAPTDDSSEGRVVGGRRERWPPGRRLWVTLRVRTTGPYPEYGN